MELHKECKEKSLKIGEVWEEVSKWWSVTIDSAATNYLKTQNETDFTTAYTLNILFYSCM